jgi:DNA-binding IclR family transcriptional regulator
VNTKKASQGKETRPGIPTAVRKSFLILETLAEADAVMPSQQLADRIGLTRSTLSRLALSLEALGYVEKAPGGVGWQLGPAALRLGLARLSTLDIRGIAAPLMRELSNDINLPVDLALPAGEQMIHFVLAQRTGQVVMATELGARLPIILTSLGHAALFVMDPVSRDQTLALVRRAAGTEWHRYEKALAASFEQLEQRGFCVVEGLLRPDVTAAGAAMVDPIKGGVFSFSCSAIGVAIETARLDREVGPKLVAMVQRVRRGMGG